MAVESFSGQQNKNCDYARLLSFLESEAGKKNCFHLIEVIEEGELVELKGRVNNLDLNIHNGKKANLPSDHTNKATVGLGKEAFTLDLAKQTFADRVFKWHHLEAGEGALEALKYELQAWPAQEALSKFLPSVGMEVTDSGATTTVLAKLKNKTLATGKAASVHVAAHQAACQVLNNAQYKPVYAQCSTGKSCGYIRADMASKDQSDFESMTTLLKKNRLQHTGKHVCDYDESTAMIYARFGMEKGGKDADAAARKVNTALALLRTNGTTKKMIAAENRRNAEKAIKAKYAKVEQAPYPAQLYTITSKLKLEVECVFNDDKTPQDLHQCVITIDGVSCSSKDTSKKFAKHGACEQMVGKLKKAHPQWRKGTLGRPEADGDAEMKEEA